MFLVGVLFSYLVVFPFIIDFLGNYQVDESVENTITLDSYISTLFAMTLTLGLVFEMPVLSWLFAKLGFLKAEYMTRYRRHAIVAIVAIAAVITPTTDVFTLMVVSVPMYLLYELSVFIVRRSA